MSNTFLAFLVGAALAGAGFGFFGVVGIIILLACWGALVDWLFG